MYTLLVTDKHVEGESFVREIIKRTVPWTCSSCGLVHNSALGLPFPSLVISMDLVPRLGDGAY